MAQGLGLVRVPLADRDLGRARNQAFAPICEAEDRRQGMVALTLRPYRSNSIVGFSEIGTAVAAALSTVYW